MKGCIYSIDYKTAISFLMPKHYSGRKPVISQAFGWYDCALVKSDAGVVGLPDISHLKAVCTFGKPASNTLCDGVCGKENSSHVYELNRLCRVEDWDQPLSSFLGACLRRLSSNKWIIVSFADTAMNHNGYIYQACNFIYTGCTKQRTEKYTEGNKHSRHYDNDKQGEVRKVRTAKHRYVYFCTYDKRQKKSWIKSLNYLPLPYPKGENANYELGNFLPPTLVRAVKD